MHQFNNVLPFPPSAPQQKIKVFARLQVLVDIDLGRYQSDQSAQEIHDDAVKAGTAKLYSILAGHAKMVGAAKVVFVSAEVAE